MILSGKVWEPDTIEFILDHSHGGDIIHAGTYFDDFIIDMPLRGLMKKTLL